MKNYQLKLILAFFIIGSIIIVGFGMFIASQHNIFGTELILTMVVALAILGLFCIAMAIFTVKKIIEPMSKMLKGTVLYDSADFSKKSNSEIENLITNLRSSLVEADSQKRQTDTILEHMTDGVIAFDMKGKVTYINPTAIQMLELKDSDKTFEKIFSKYEDINMEKIIYLESWTSSEVNEFIFCTI